MAQTPSPPNESLHTLYSNLMSNGKNEIAPGPSQESLESYLVKP